MSDNKIHPEAKFYQMISRNNDVNGNPYRLIFVYNGKAAPVQVFEARSSSPNVEHDLYRAGVERMLTIHTQPGEYNRLKRAAKNWFSVANGVEYSD